MEPLLKIYQIAEILNCSPSNAYAIVASGELKSFRVGAGKAGIRCSMAQITEYLKARESGPPPQEAPAPVRLKHLR
jgi:hypothetical protein